MKSLTQALIDKVLPVFSGKRREKFLISIAAINDSLAQGSWVPGMSRKAQTGLYQGIAKARVPSDVKRALDMVCTAEWYCTNMVESMLNYGKAPYLITKKESDFIKGSTKMPKTLDEQIALGVKTIRTHSKLKFTDDVIDAWAKLCTESHQAMQFLDAQRPAPVITKIGLSPKVTKTLTEMNLDIDLSSIRYPDIERRKVKILNKKGEEVEVEIPFIKWTKGIVHNASRFATGGANCHACGKYIPSGRFVPIEAKDKKNNRLVSMWLGCDCANKIFGVKDVGVDRVTVKE